MITILVGVIVFALLFFAWLYLDRHAMLPWESSKAPRTLRPLPTPKAAMDMSQVQCSTDLYLATPLRLNYDGLPMLELWIGRPAQPLRVVFDTASTSLVLAGASCAQCAANGAGAENGHYDESASSTAMDALDETGETTYGTQLDQWKTATDVVACAGYCVENCHALLENPPSDNAEESVLHLGLCDFKVTTARLPSAYAHVMGGEVLPQSNYSICGMGPSSEILKQLSPSEMFTMVFSKHRTYVLFRDAGLKKGHPRVPRVLNTSFYMVALKEMRYDGSVVATPRKVLLDSGSNFLFAPTAVCETLQKGHRAHLSSEIEIVFDGVVGDDDTPAEVALRIPRDAYANVNDSREVYCAPSHDDDDYLILGTLLLENMAVQFGPTDVAFLSI